MTDNKAKRVNGVLSRAISSMVVGVAALLAPLLAIAQNTPPAPDANCTVIAFNRSAPLQSDYSFTIFNIPAATLLNANGVPAGTSFTPPFRVRATCSDGTVGETELAFGEPGQDVIYTGPIFWRPATPLPLALGVTASSSKLSAGQTAQLTATGILANAATVDLSTRNKGTLYTSSNPTVASVGENGLVTVNAQVATSSSARVVVVAQNEGVAGSTVLAIGPRGRVTGRVTRADGTAAAAVQVTVLRNQPRETVGTVTTDSAGNYAVDDVTAGGFSVSVIDPATGDQARGAGVLDTDGQTKTIDMRLNGLGAVTVNVVNAANAPVGNAEVTFSSLSGFRDTRTLRTNGAGQVVFDRAMAGDFTVSTRDLGSNLVGATVGLLAAGGSAGVTLKLQPVGAISGVVFNAGGAEAQSGVQVRLISLSRGIVSQSVTGADGAFRFDSLPLIDGPYTLDAVAGGRMRARVPGIVLSVSGQEVAQNLVFVPSGTVSGVITSGSGTVIAGATVNLQSLVGERWAFTAKTDAQGRYMIEGVPLGAFSVTASREGGGETASAGGNVAGDGQSVALNMQLAAGGIVGTVFQRDGITPVGAGIAVTLKPGSLSTQTNAQGQFSFPISQPNTYTVEAADGQGNRGRTQISLIVINPNAPATVNVAFLGRGIVQGTVRDSTGVVQPNLSVRLTSSSVFGGEFTVTSDAQGRYRFDDVFVGAFTLYARNERTQLAGYAQQITRDGETVTADIVLAATGSVSGRVVRQDNTTPLPNASLELYVGGALVLRGSADATGQYSFPAVPLGDIRVVANDGAGDKGQSLTRLTALGDVRTANIRMLGLGSVRVRVVDSDGQALPGAAVQLSSQSQFGGYQAKAADASGIAQFDGVFNGDYSLSGSRTTGSTTLSGQATGTLVNGVTAQAVLTLTSNLAGTGRIVGVVTSGLNALPRGGVRVQAFAAGVLIDRVTDADGAFAFDNMPVNSGIQLTALIDGRIRARELGVTIPSQGTTLTRNLALIGVGTVRGVVRNAQSQPLGGARVQLNNPDSIYGGTYSVTSAADGSYSIADVAAGTFTVRADSPDFRLQGQESGRVRFDADVVTADIMLVDNAVTMPRALRDANGNVFDVQGDGSIAQGTNNVFAGNGVDARATRLDVLVGGVPVPFTNGDGTVGRLTQGGQLLEVDELHAASGLNVARRIYVPKTGYFARFLEVLENRSSNPVTVALRVTTNMAPGVVGARVVDSSDGDAVVSLSGAARDRWVVLDDDRDGDPFEVGGSPSVAVVFDGAEAAQQVDHAAATAIGSTALRFQWQWANVTIEPGASVAYMHFAAQQLGRIPAREAASRLVQLPPEALEGLSAQERALIRNFNVPAEGSGSLAPLPALTAGQVTGTVYAGDGVTPMPSTVVTLKSKQPLYQRTHRVNVLADGRFSFAINNFSAGALRAIPIDRFALTASYASTGALTDEAVVSFPEGQSDAQQDLVFNRTGILRGTVRRHSGALVTQGSVTVPYTLPSGQQVVLSATIQADGGYRHFGLRADDYLADATTSHPQGLPITGALALPAAVPAGGVTVADINMEPTGEIRGVVLDPTGQPAVNAQVRLDPSGCCYQYRVTLTDTGGVYRFTDVSAGSHNVLVTGANGLSASGNVAVSVDTQAVLDLQVQGTGTINVQVNYQRGVGAPNSVVYANLLGSVRTNAVGQVQFTGVVGRNYSFTAYHPDNSNLTTSGNVQLAAHGENVTLNLTLPAAGEITGQVLRQDGVTPAAGVLMTVRRLNSAEVRTVNTNSSGVYRFVGLPTAAYYLSAEDRTAFKFADASPTLDTDGQTIEANLVLGDNRIALPATLSDANNFQFDVQRNASIAAGTYAFNNGGALLELDGQAFTGDSSAFLEAGRRQFSVRQATPISGLNVTRKVFVPVGGYFARYLEVLENPGSAPVTVSVRLRNRYAGAMGYIESSSGDDVITASGASRDLWFAVDDANDSDPFLSRGTLPSLAYVLGQEDASLPPSSLSMLGSQETEALWSNLTVPAGGRVALMHFNVQQVNRAGARAAALRLQQLPPEALQSLSAEEIAAIANFRVPADGQSTVDPLPSLTGRVDARVFEGDGQTVVANVPMQFRSRHPLFNRSWVPPASGYACSQVTIANQSWYSAADGRIGVSGVVRETNSMPLPVGHGYEVSAAYAGCLPYYVKGHPTTRIGSRTGVAEFAAGQSQASVDVLFDSVVLNGTVTGPSDYGVGGGTLSLSSFGQLALIAGDGSYLIRGVPAGNFTLGANINHNQGTSLIGSRAFSVAAIGQNLVVDVPVEPTGALNGAVLTAGGTPATGMSVSITGTVNGRQVYRTTRTDSLGQYNLSAVPAGSYTLEATNSRDNARTSVNVSVAERQVVVQNVTLIGTGAVSLTVNYARGAAAPDVNVYLQAAAIGPYENYVGRTDGQGRLTVQVPVGAYTLRARHPARYDAISTSTGSITADSQVVSTTLALPAIANIRVTVVDQDNADTPVPGASISFTNALQGTSYVGTTDAAGQLLINNLSEGSFTVRANTAQGRTVSSAGSITAAQDGQTVGVTLGLSSRDDLLGTMTFGWERRLYSVPVRVGDTLAVRISGAQVGQTAPIYLLRADARDTALQAVASGYGYGPDGGYAQYNDYGNLQGIPVTVDGNYTVALSPYYSNRLGGFRAQALVNGVAVPLLPYQDGGTVSGRLFRADGQTPVANAVLQLTGHGGPVARLRTTTDAEGAYQFVGVPIGAFDVGQPLDAGLTMTVLRSGTVESAGQAIAFDLSQLPVTQINVQVRLSDGSPASNGLVRFGGAYVRADAAGQASYTYVGLEPLTVTAYHPEFDLPSGSQVVQPADGQTRSLVLTVATASLSGRVLDAGGQGVASTYVRLARTSDGDTLNAVYTDASGTYVFERVPALLPMTVSADHPSTGVRVSRELTLAADQVLDGVDLQLSGEAQIHGRVTLANGLPVTGVVVRAQWAVDPLNLNDTREAYGETGADGRYVMTGVPPGVEVQVQARYTGVTEVATPVQAATLANGEDRAVDLVFDSPGYARIKLMASDGQPVDGICAFSIYPAGWYYGGEGGLPPGSAQIPCSAEAVFPGIPSGDMLVRVNASWTLIVPVTTDGETENLITLRVETIRGRVTYADGSGVPEPGVSWTMLPDGETVYQHASDLDGNYVLYLATAGEGRLDAQDWRSGLAAARTATLSAGVPLGLDLALPPSGTVTGVLRDRSGAVVPHTQVYVRSSALDLDRSVETDENGVYVVTQVAAGNVTVLARLANQHFVMGSGVLGGNATLTVDLDEPEQGSVSGRVTVIGTGAPVAGATVILRSAMRYGPFGVVELSTQADEQGAYRFEAAPLGVVGLTASVQGAFVSSNVSAEVSSGGNTVADITVEPGVQLPMNLTGTDTSRYDVQCNGSLGDGGYANRYDAYDGAYALSVNGESFPCQAVAALRSGGREIAFAPQLLANGLQVARRIYVPAAGGYARYIELFTNLSTSEIVVPVTIASNLGSDGGTRIMVAPSATSNRYAVTRDTGSADPSLAHVFGGTGAPQSVSETRFSENVDAVYYQWSLVVPAGSTMALLHYAVQRAVNDTTAAELQAQALANGTQPGMFTGLSQAERASVRNFLVPQQ